MATSVLCLSLNSFIFLFHKEFHMARPQQLDDNMVVSVRIEKEDYSLLHEIAALESLNSGRKITVQELIRNSIKFVYSDNERLRECFRKSRSHITKRSKKFY